MRNATRSDFPADVFGFADALRISQGTRWNASLPHERNALRPEPLRPIVGAKRRQRE